MRPLTAVIIAVGKGKISVRFGNGTTACHKTDRDFGYGEQVLVLYDCHNLVVKDVMYPNEMSSTDDPAPACAPLERSTDDEVPIDVELEVEDSSPTPAAPCSEFSSECSGELSELELESEDSFSTCVARLSELSGDGE